MTGRADVVVVGGGLAGLAAALRCADAGASVAVIERRPRLGGLTWSFQHQGRWVDNGQHVFLRCCDAYTGFLRRIGSLGDVSIQPRLDVTVLRPRPAVSGRLAAVTSGRLRRNGMPAPLHLAPSLLNYPHLGLADRLKLGRAALALRRVGLGDPSLDRQTFAAWLSDRGQSEEALAAVWDLITLPTVNLPASQASAAMGAKVFQTGLLTDTSAADIGWSRVPLGRLHGDAAAAALGEAGVEVSLGEKVLSVAPVKGHSPSRLDVRSDRRTLSAGAVVLAVPHDAVNGLVPPAAFRGQERLAGLGTSPIVDVHVLYDRRVTDLPFAAGLDSVAQWVFDRTASSGVSRGQYLAVSISAADAYVGRHPTQLAREVVDALGDLFPAARTASVTDTLVTKERAATFRAVPGTAALRPGPVTDIPGLLLAGAWTDTGWPATMEGAVRSGTAAAGAALALAGATPSRPYRIPEEVA